MSQGDIEKRTGLLRCYLSRVENGHTVPSLETLQKIAGALDLPLSQFFDEQTASARCPASPERGRNPLPHPGPALLRPPQRKRPPPLLAMVRKFAATSHDQP